MITRVGHSILIGDSLVQDWQPMSPGFLDTNRIRPAGIGGQVVAQVAARFVRDTVGFGTAAVLVGTNDVAGNAGPYSPDHTIANFRRIVDAASEADIGLVLCLVPPANRYFWSPDVAPGDHILDLNRRLGALAGERGICVADCYGPLDNGQGGLAEYHTTDGVHLTREAYLAIEPVVLAALDLARVN